ncbi:hypothetical protein [Robiginitalea aurantiaca]|uniref:Uncharacterized protein n=1 Tax=Robiginitalea aurantiaca TaxID=3056915 RepID=A0ABT7WFV8_9FLAO|nr:hypothetical protein [Robiginitalea aurantiaca]MDM9631804.1 hypothetical protein [Robiginitalea aurantiaca]
MNFETGFRELLDDWNSQWNRAIRITLAQKSTLPLKEYLYRVYYYSDLLDMHNTKVSRQQPEHRALSRGQNISRIALLLFLSMLIFVHHWIPDGQNQIEILGLEIGCFGFRDLSTFLFYASNKFVLCVLGLIWLLNTQYWWRGAILSPVLLYLYQFWEIFQPMPVLESEGNLKIMPLIALTISAVALLWALIKRISENQVYQTLLKSELDKGLRELSREKAKSRLFQMQVHNPEIL